MNELGKVGVAHRNLQDGVDRAAALDQQLADLEPQRERFGTDVEHERAGGAGGGARRARKPSGQVLLEELARRAGCSAHDLKSSLMAWVSRAPSSPNCTPKPPGFNQRMVPGRRDSALVFGRRSTMISSVPKVPGVSVSMNMPPMLMSLTRPKMVPPPLTSHVTFALRGTRG